VHQPESPPPHQQELSDASNIPTGPRQLGNDTTLGLNSPIDELKKTAHFIKALQSATLEESNMQQEDIDRLRAAELEPRIDMTDKHFVKALSIFLSMTNTSQTTYNAICTALFWCYLGDPFLSFGQMKQRIKKLSGVVLIFNNMCPDTCIGFTGPLVDHVHCPLCGKDHY